VGSVVAPVEVADAPVATPAQEVKADRSLTQRLIWVLVVASGLWLALAAVAKRR
jgi:hypothetical protein